MSGGMARDCLNLCWSLDLLLQGRIASCGDSIAQRIKSLEMTCNGASWQVSQRLEVAPQEKGQLSSRLEANAAVKENREEEKTRRMSKGKDGSKGEGYPPWRAKKGEGKDKGGKGKNRKGEKEEAKK